MALTSFQRDICRLLAGNRLRDIDLFHDTEEALAASWTADRDLLEREGYILSVIRERPTFVEAEVGRGDDSVVVQWAQDSAYRFFPLVQHEELGLALHPFDLATGKVLALVGRVEPRDFVDTLTCDREVQPLGYLAWAACGKDPGFSPIAILELASRSARYSEAELRGLDFEGEAPDAAALARWWRTALETAREIVGLLHAQEPGRAVLARDGTPYRLSPTALREALTQDELLYHEGRIRGAFPRIVR